MICPHCPFAGRDVTCLGVPGECAGGQLLPTSEFPSAIAPDARARVGIVCPSLGLGGAESVDHLMARSTDPGKIRWEGIATAFGREACSPAAIARMNLLMPVGHGLGAVRELAARVDVLTSWAVLDYGAIFEGLRRPPRVIQTAHFPAESAFGGPTLAMLGPHVARWVAVSGLALESMPEAIRSDAQVIWNAVEPGRLEVRRDREAMRRSWGVPEGAKVAGYLGRLAPEKDPLAMARLADALPADWRAVVVGDGPLAGQLAGSRAIAVEGDPAAGDVLNAFDVLVAPSLYESFGLAIAEGIAKRKPLVCTEVGLAKLEPGIGVTIPIGADGLALAKAVLAAWAAGPTPEATALIPRLDPGRFGREWTELLLRTADTQATRLARVVACPERGGVLPLSMQDDCGCQGRELSACRSGRGKVPGRVTLQDCLRCQTMKVSA